jgi:hypothetical protein
MGASVLGFRSNSKTGVGMHQAPIASEYT